MRSDDRSSLRQRFGFRCGYCGVRETDVGSQLTVDHFMPRSQGGRDDPDNWVYCCHACNEFKGSYWQPDSPRRILHPLRDPIDEHIVQREDGVLLGLTETGRFHVQRLKLNRAGLVAYRQERRLTENTLQAQRDLLQRMQRLEQEVNALRQRIQRLENDNSPV